MHLNFIQAMNELDLSSVKSRNEVDRALRVAIPELTTRQFLLTNLRSPTPSNAGYTWAGNVPLLAVPATLLRLRDWPFDVCRARQFAAPTLFVRGARSPYVTDQWFDEARDTYFPNASLLSVDDAAHWVHSVHLPIAVVFLSQY
jgi:esterase